MLTQEILSSYLERSKQKQNAERLANAEHNVCLAQLRGKLPENNAWNCRRSLESMKIPGLGYP